ncbi:carboxymuconolactone decarboxylase family protein [Phytomonospora sp. NPDC050363]|uniref:carboxymuconolactone decarboxylase family protein n=1 Tax=Phytomonospora sp. NPDC050363 TaxID=3155642 RepID=UPI0033E259C8
MSKTIAQDDLQSRLPEYQGFADEMMAIAGSMTKIVYGGSIARTTVHLVQLRAAQIAGSTYHTIRQTDLLRKAGESEERVTAVASWRDAPYFTDAELVALELVEAVLTHNAHGERVSDELFARASEHYDLDAMWRLIVVIGQISFFIPVAAIAKPIPGKAPGKNYSK